jgi:hypothetical protein
MSRRPWFARSIGLLVGLAVSGPGLDAGWSRAAAQQAEPAAVGGVDQAIRQARASRRDLVVVLTSEALPSSRRFYLDLTAAAAGRGATAVFHELVAEREPARARQLSATALPSVYVYRMGGERGISQAGRLAAPRTVEEADRWLGLLEEIERTAAQSSGAERDQAVARASHGYTHDLHAHATPQGAPPPPPAPPQVMQPQAPPTVGQPMLGGGIPQPSIVVPTPSPSVYVQPQPPTIVVGTPTTANVVYASNVGTPTLGVPAAPAAAPALGVAPSAAPVQVLGQAPAAQQQVVGLVLERPGLWRRLLAALGRELSSLGNPRIRMASMPEFAQVSIPTAPAVGVAPPAQPPAVIVPREEPDRPSPQRDLSKKHGFFHRD